MAALISKVVEITESCILCNTTWFKKRSCWFRFNCRVTAGRGAAAVCRRRAGTRRASLGKLQAVPQESAGFRPAACRWCSLRQLHLARSSLLSCRSRLSTGSPELETARARQISPFLPHPPQLWSHERRGTPQTPTRLSCMSHPNSKAGKEKAFSGKGMRNEVEA